jgi:type IV pilus assembly protein PilQ
MLKSETKLLKLGLLAVVAALAFAGVADAQEMAMASLEAQGPPTTAITTTPSSSHQQRISVDFVETPLNRVIELIAKQTNKNIVLDRGVEEAVTIKLTDAPWLDAIKVIADRAGCIVELAGENIYRVRKPPRITMEFRDADLKAAIDILAAQAGANVIIAEDITGKVNLRLKNVPWKHALEQVVKTANYAIVEEEGGLIRVVTPEALALQLETWMFPLRYLRPPSTYVAQIDTDYAVGRPEPFDMSKLREEFGVFRAVDSALSESGTVDYIPETNTIIATDTVTKLEEVKRIIQEMDKEPGQIFVQVRFITTTNDDLLNYGVKWENGLAIRNSLGSVVSRLPFNLYNGGWEEHIAAKDDGVPTFADVDDYLADADKTLFTFGTLDFTDTLTFLELVEKDSESKIVQSPVLTILDKTPSTIFSGERIRFAQSQAATAQAGQLQTAIREADTSPVDVGFQLLVIPYIIPDQNEVLMTIIPEATSLSGRSAEMPGFDVFNIGEESIALPRTASRTVVTQMILGSGRTAIIGGLADKTESETVTKVPFLGYIPILGHLFTHKGTSSVDATLLILVSVDIVQKAHDTTKLLHEDWSDVTIGLLEPLSTTAAQ